MLHPEVLTISYKHRHDIKKAFKDIVGLYGVTHLSLDLVRPDGEMLFLSSTPSHGYEVCSKGYGKYDATIAAENFQNREFYWWHDVKYQRYAQEIEYIKRVKHGFRYGFMMVRRMDDFYLIYSFATKRHDKQFIETVNVSRDVLFEAGDYVYGEMRQLYSEYTGEYAPPEINQFYKYQGGKPEARTSKALHSEQTTSHNGLSKIKISPHLKLVVDNE